VDLHIIDRSFYREAGTVTVAIVVVLTSLFLLQGAGVLLAQTAEDAPQRNVVMVLLVLNTLKDYGVLLLLSAYVGVLFTVSRWYRDSEMAVLAACGIGTTRLLRPVLVFAFAFAIVISVQSFWLRPLVFQAIAAVHQRVAERKDIGWISEGTFNESTDGRAVVYVESSSGSRMRNLFVEVRGTPGRVVVAREGREFKDTATGAQILELRDGASYEGQAGSANYRMVRFQRYRMWLTSGVVSVASGKPEESMGTGTLLRSQGRGPVYRAELESRIGKPIMVIILAALALTLSYADPRRGRFVNLFISVVFFFLYSNLLGIAKTLMREGRLPTSIGMWWVHILFAAIAAWFLLRRHQGRPLASWPWRWRRT
jgi:lipopolysaccharide export system permease protein